MSVIQTLQNLSFTSRIGRTEQAPQGLKPYAAVDQTANSDFRRARDKLLDLYRSLETLAELTNIDTRFKLDLPDARSSSGLGLDLTSLAAALASTEEINASPMSFSPFGPDWAGASTALVSIDGEYYGADGTDTLTLEARRNGIHGVNNLIVRVEDSLGNLVSNVSIGRNDPLDQQYDLGNGLFLTLGPGALVNRDTATLQVFDNVGAVVDPGKPLGGIRNDNPNLQFGTPSIIDGSFVLNGENISVSTSDSIDDVISRINSSTAGVTATFNALTERIDFLQDNPGSAPTIDLQGDTSNFLQAVKLAGAIVTPGTDPEDDIAFENVGTFASVISGDIQINGEQISIDTTTDSLSSVLERINASAAGVVASFDSGTQRVVIEAQDTASELNLDSNGTGFFAALNIPEGRVDPEAVSRGISRQRSYSIADATAAAFAEISDLFRDTSFVGRDANAARFRAPLESAIRGLYGSSMSGDVFGLRFDGSAEARLRGDFASIDRQVLTRSLQLRGDAVHDVLGKNGEGLIQSLLIGARQALTNVNQALGISGTFIDSFA